MKSQTYKISFPYKDLLIAWTTRILSARYQQSILGGLWAVVQPAASAAILTVIFTMFLKVDTGEIPYLVFSYSALVPWIFFSSSISDMVDSIVSNMNLVGKIYFPRDILVFSALLARMLDFSIAFCVLIIIMLFYRMPVFTVNWLFIPVILAVQMALGLGLGLAGAALNVFYRDVKHLLGLFLQLWFYATPIIYPLTLVPDWLRPFYVLNPMAGVIASYRDVLLYGTMPGSSLLVAAALALIVLFAGYQFFKRVEIKMADVI